MSKRVNEVTILSLDDFGRGIAYLDNKTIFIPDMLPQEKALIETTFEYGKLKDVKVIKRLKSSPFRVEPSCPYYPKCGGCQLMHLDYKEQLKYKKEKVKNLFKKFASLDIDVDDTISLVSPYHYRNKVQKPIKLVQGKIAAGYYSLNTHKLVPISSCLLESNLATKITNYTLKLFQEFKYKPYDEDTMEGDIRHLLIKTNSDSSEALVTIVVKDAKLKGRKEFAKRLISKISEVKGVVFNINNRHTNVILGEKDVPIYGYTRIKDQIFTNKFLISSHSFYQVNSKQVENLYSLAIKGAELNKEDILLDAYCGTGTIGLSCAREVKEVYGVEIVKQAVADAKINAKINNISNAHFISDDCTEFMKKTTIPFSVVIMDPPRKGATVEFLQSLINLRPQKVVYVSCDPVTLARDINILKDYYEVKRVTPVDMFPFTLHVETICALSFKGQK